ncbi:MAG: DUF4395 domain-containing protein [Microbacteriaceae bacterium]
MATTPSKKTSTSTSKAPSGKSGNPLAAKPGTTGIDPRGPRFGAVITFILLGIDVILGLTGPSVQSGTSWAVRITDPAFILLLVITLIFAWGSFAGISRHPYGLLFRALIRPRLSAPTELEDPIPPTFAQLIGFVVTSVGIVLALLGVPYGLVVAAAFAFIAAFLNGVFGYCLGCQIYVLLVRAGILGRARA